MRIIKLAWVGTRTGNAEPTVAFFRDVLGLRLELERPGFWMLKLPDGSKVESLDPTVRSTGTSPPVPSPGSSSTTSTVQPPSCGPPVSRSSLSRRSTTAGTPGRTSAPRTETSTSSPRTLLCLDRTEPDGDGRSRRRLFPLQSRAAWTSGSPTGWTGCWTAWALPPTTTQHRGHPRVPGADGFEGQRRSFSEPELDRVPPGVRLGTTEDRWSRPFS
jgi:catechol 2,3-dioxygenase-like lactoylglutathione lyase family enzyme